VSIVAFDHYNLSAHRTDLERLRDFYVEVVGLREGPRPPIQRWGYWLYAGDAPVLHLIEARPSELRQADVAGTFNHVAFRADRYDATLASLVARGIAARPAQDPGQSLRQLFFRDPMGNGVELSFASDADR
jgi:catechol-2,3-dioxygenase